VGEPLYLLVRLKNDSNGEIPVAPLKISSSDIAGNLGIVMTRENGVREFHPPYVESGPETISPAAELLPLLEPGKRWMIVVELLSYFSEEKGLISHPDNRIQIGSGSYSLQAFYRWDFHPSVVIRSETLSILIDRPPVRDKWKRWRFGRTSSKLLRGALLGDPIRLCREIYSLDYNIWMSGDIIRASIMDGLEKDSLGTIGAFYIVEENQGGAPLFLYDLITYRETLTGQESKEERIFLDELTARWPDSFIGEVAMQKKRFEKIALGRTHNAIRSSMVEEENR